MPGNIHAEDHFWQVIITRYPSEEAKRHIEKRTMWQLPAEEQDRLSVTASTLYYGWGERWASVRFYRACRDGMADPLVDHVMMLQSGHMVACVVIDHTLRFGAQ